ncbi:MAG: Uncharacterized protein Greene041614_1097 [Parcubacteria group bacterium Greene0416_14]|nr:MAG: Uncharacterized protein Greene041614_1097 [Parcubacteria group bacterium Greene0416_14]
MRTSSGFTLIEMLLSISLLVLMGGIAIPIYYSFQVRNDLDIVTASHAQLLRRAQALARAGGGDISWGVHLTGTNMILFKGVDFLSRDSSFDETIELPPSITPSGLQDVIFSKFTGLPQTTGITTFTSNQLEARTSTINEKGMVNF